MGYESRFYVVDKIKIAELEKKGKHYSDEIAKFDMGKMGYNSYTLKLVQEATETECYVFADDGNTRIFEDNYGEPLKELDVKPLIKALKKDDDGDRRIKPLIAFLETLNPKQWEELKVLHYGY